MEFGHDLADTGGHIQTDRIHQFDRSHRHAEIERGLVDGAARNAFRKGQNRFLHVRCKDAVDQKARRSGDRYRQLVDAAAESGQSAFGFSGHAAVTDDFNQRHHRHRVEVMQSRKARGLRELAAQRVQCNRAGIGNKQRVRLHFRFQRGV